MMATISEPINIRNYNDAREFKNSLCIPIITDEKKRQELTDALEHCHLLLFQNGLSTQESSEEISIRSKEIGRQMFFCMVLFIKDILSKEKEAMSYPNKREVIDSSNSPFIKEETVNDITQPCVKNEVNEAPKIEEIMISSSEDECDENPPSLVESKGTEEKEESEKSQLNHNSSTELPRKKSHKKLKSAKGNSNVIDTEHRQFKEFQIDSWVYKQIMILKNRSAPINAKTVKNLALKASAVYSFPEFKPTKKWLKRFLEIYNLSFDNDNEESTISNSVSECEDTFNGYGIMFNVKRKMTQSLEKYVPVSKGSANSHSVKSCMGEVSLNDFTPIVVDVPAMEINSKQSKGKPVKGKNSSGKQSRKKFNRGNKGKNQTVNKSYQQLRINAWVYEQLKILKKNSIDFDLETVQELVVKAADVFFQFHPPKGWTKRFWKVYGGQLKRFEEDTPVPRRREKKSGQPLEEDTSMNCNSPLDNQEETSNMDETKNKSFSFSTEEELSSDCIPICITKPEPDEIWVSSSDSGE